MSNASDIKLSCREAQLIMKVMDPDKDPAQYTPEEAAALVHYSDLKPVDEICRDCHSQGLAALTGKPMTCQDALLIWARRPDHCLINLSGCNSLKEALASEHVVGRYFPTQRKRMPYESTFVSHHLSCEGIPCRVVSDFWRNAGLCSHYDGGRETAKFIPLLLLVFKRAGWPLNELLNIQRHMFTTRLREIRDGLQSNVPRLEAHVNFRALQALATPDWKLLLNGLINDKTIR